MRTLFGEADSCMIIDTATIGSFRRERPTVPDDLDPFISRPALGQGRTPVRMRKMVMSASCPIDLGI